MFHDQFGSWCLNANAVVIYSKSIFPTRIIQFLILDTFLHWMFLGFWLFSWVLLRTMVYTGTPLPGSGFCPWGDTTCCCFWFLSSRRSSCRHVGVVSGHVSVCCNCDAMRQKLTFYIICFCAVVRQWMESYYLFLRRRAAVRRILLLSCHASCFDMSSS